jgi:multidrug efflux pump subunit AcrB
VMITLLPLGPRASIVVMISIPLSLLIGLFLLDLFHYTINQLSIVGMVVALGLLVDDSIVVVENIERYLRLGYARKEAAMAATRQIGLAVLGCTATLIFAFLPLMFLPEGAGDFIRSLPAAVVTTVLPSPPDQRLLPPAAAYRHYQTHRYPAGGPGYFYRLPAADSKGGVQCIPCLRKAAVPGQYFDPAGYQPFGDGFRGTVCRTAS